MYLKEDIGPWFDHEDKLPNRPLFRHPEALALGQNATIDRPLVEGVIMVLKVIVQFVRFLAVAVYFRESDNPKIYLPLGIIGFVSGVVEAMLSFWKEVAARVHKPGEPTYTDRPRSWIHHHHSIHHV